MSDSSQSTRSLGRNEKGAVYVEFLIVFPPIFVLFLVTMQWAILSASDLGVRHSAAATVRSAIVILPDDPAYYDGELTNLINPTASCSEGVIGKIHKVLKKIGINSGVIPDDGKCIGGARMATIRFAAIMRMMPFAPNPSQIAPAAFGGVIEGLGTAGWVVGAAAYAYGATAVTFPKEPGSDELTYNWAPGSEVTVRVTYLAHCGIPIARFLMCDKSTSMIRQKGAADIFTRDFSASQAVQDRVERAKDSMEHMKMGVGNHTIFAALLVSGERFQVLSAEATLPLASAPYEFPTKE